MALPNQFKSARMTDSTDRATIDTHVGDLEQAICDIFGFTINQDIASDRAVFGSFSTENSRNRPARLWLDDTEANMGASGNSGLRIFDSTNDDEVRISVVDGFLVFYNNTGTEAAPTWTERTKMDLSDGTWSQGLGFKGVKVYDASSQSITKTVETALEADTEAFDTDAFHDPGSLTRITIPSGLAGYYLVTARILVAGPTLAATSFVTRIKKNAASDIIEDWQLDFAPTYDITYRVSSVVSLAESDFIEVTVLYDSASAGPVPMKLIEFSAILLGQ